jgi:RNA polymerase sigma factor for flagellar operon FliA
MQQTYDEEDAAHPTTTSEAADARLTSYLAGIATAMAVGSIASARDGAEIAAASATPEELAIDVELLARVKAILETLPQAERTLIERHYFGEETLDQAAASLGLSKSWGSRLHARAIEAIARELRRQERR